MTTTHSSIALFAEITRRVIAKEGFDRYLPTVLYPARNHIMVLEGVPATVDLETVALNWARSNAIDSEEFLLAFKVDTDAFKIIRTLGPVIEFEVFTL